MAPKKGGISRTALIPRSTVSPCSVLAEQPGVPLTVAAPVPLPSPSETSGAIPGVSTKKSTIVPSSNAACVVSCAVALIIFGTASAAAASAAAATAVCFTGSSGMFTGHANQMPAGNAFCLSFSCGWLSRACLGKCDRCRCKNGSEKVRFSHQKTR